jgi:hypothetical protein
MAEGEEYGGFCGGVDGDGRERVRVLGSPMELLTEGFRSFREKVDVLSLKLRGRV